LHEWSAFRAGQLRPPFIDDVTMARVPRFLPLPHVAVQGPYCQAVTVQCRVGELVGYEVGVGVG
jgi:hypothetical protein